MRIKLSPQRRDDILSVVRAGDVLEVNGELFDFSQMSDDDTLPWAAIKSIWFSGDVEKVAGELTLTLLLPNPINFSAEQAFPVDLVDVPNGAVVFPAPLSVEAGEQVAIEVTREILPGQIDWSQLVTKAMKAASLQAAQLAEAKAELATKNSKAVTQIARVHDRVNTIGYGIDAGEATEADVAEQAALIVNLKAWKSYKFALGKVTTQATWYAAPVWPVEPAVPVIVADPQTIGFDVS